jgi:hypothetical protein
MKLHRYWQTVISAQMQVTVTTVTLTRDNGNIENVLVISVIPPVYKPHTNVNKAVTVGCEILTLVVMKNSVFGNMTPCSLLKFRGTCPLHLWGLRLS